MRAIRTTTISILALGLLAGSAVGVAAQDEGADPAAQAAVTGSVERWVVVPGETTTFDAEVSRTEGRRTFTSWFASDPRLSGEETITANWDLYPSPDLSVPEVGVGAMTRVLVNDEGRWVGPTGIAFDSGFDPGRRDVVVMRGEGAYEGLTAIILMDRQGETYASFTGVIFEGEMPPFPELPAE